MHIDPEQQQSLVARRRWEQQQVARHLRGLPQELPQPYDWLEFRRRASERANAGGLAGVRTRKYMAIAAALVLAMAAMAAWVRATRLPPSFAAQGPSAADARMAISGLAVTGSGAMLTAGPGDSAASDGVETRVSVAERWLASLPNEPTVVRVGTRSAVTGLEDRIAQLDDLLSAARVEGAQPARLQRFEEQRARLVKSLVQVRYAEALVTASR